MAYSDKKKADKLDNFLKKEVNQIEERLSAKGLVDLKGKSGSIKLWFNVGLELRRLWNKVKCDYEMPDTFIGFFLKAVYDNSNRIRSAPSRAERFKNSLFYYCYLLAGFPQDMIEASGSWAEWSDFFDSKRIRNDPRIIKWFIDRNVIEHREKENFTRHKWFKFITRRIRNELRKIDTTVLEKNELFQKLDGILLRTDSK